MGGVTLLARLLQTNHTKVSAGAAPSHLPPPPMLRRPCRESGLVAPWPC